MAPSPAERGVEPTPGSIPFDLARFMEWFGGEDLTYPVTISEIGTGRFRVVIHTPDVQMAVHADHVVGVSGLDAHGVVSGTASEVELTESVNGINLAFEDFEPI